MADKDLVEKEAYFKDHELLDFSDDETDFPDEGLIDTERAGVRHREEKRNDRADRVAHNLKRQTSYLGPVPKAVHANRGTQEKQLPNPQSDAPDTLRTSSPPDAEVNIGSSKAVAGGKLSASSPKQSKHTASVTNTQHNLPFWKAVGDIPRGIRNKKKPANIALEPEARQVLKNKIIYFYPEDDKGDHLFRIHKVISYGAAWVAKWRPDVTHIMLHPSAPSYKHLLKHLNMTSIPPGVILVKYDPYVPDSIRFRQLLNPTLGRFQVEGAPQSINSIPVLEPSSSPASVISLQIKPSKRKRVQDDSQEHKRKARSLLARSKSGPVVAPDVQVQSEVLPCGGYNDELSEAIREAKALNHLPLDPDDDEATSRSSNTGAAGAASNDEIQDRAKRPVDYNIGKLNQGTFQCMESHNGLSNAQNPNARTIEILQDMSRHYEQTSDQWRSLAYRKGISVLKKQNRKISVKEEARKLSGIGDRLAEKIEEIVMTDRLRKLDATRDDPLNVTLQLFLGIYGVGLSQANKWIAQGYETLDDLLKYAHLTKSQKIGIAHYDDFAARIPRAEVEAHGEVVRKALRKLDSGFEVIIMGSYRRGAESSGDVDLIISKKRTSLNVMRTMVYETLVPQLIDKDFLKAGLATAHKDDGTKWHGASAVPGSSVWRRIDLLLVPESEMGAALIYFTGNDIFNRSIRLLASKKGMRLNQHGLYKDVIRGKNRERITEGTLLEGRDESRIFEILGVPWRPPHERVC